MFLLNQPFNGQLGDLLIAQMSHPFNKLTILSAFAKNSGVLRIKPALERFSQNGGTIDAFIGIDAFGTSYEALLNLFHLCDSLYIVHSESPITTFHSKIYALSDENNMWLAVGSNNLTGGGLWTNFESASCFEIDAFRMDNQEYKNALLALIAQYENDDYECSRRINSEDDLLQLLNADYVRSEVRIHIETVRRNRQAHRDLPAGIQFGTHMGIQVPQLERQHTGAVIRTSINSQPVRATQAITETNGTERIWFETKAMTGGSRNILDLSKIGTICSGSALGSRYETDNSQIMVGGVAFFDIEPENTNIEKDITINYNGIDFTPCTIKFAPNNGSWRIQLKGDDPSRTHKLHTVEGVEWLVHTILIFEKIRTDYYCMSVVGEDELISLQEQSFVVAHNGSGQSSKLFGLF